MAFGPENHCEANFLVDLLNPSSLHHSVIGGNWLVNAAFSFKAFHFDEKKCKALDYKKIFLYIDLQFQLLDIHVICMCKLGHL